MLLRISLLLHIVVASLGQISQNLELATIILYALKILFMNVFDTEMITPRNSITSTP